MNRFRAAFLREDGYLLGGLTAVPIGMWFLVGAIVQGLAPSSTRGWTGPALLLIPLVLLGEILVRRFYGARRGVPPTVFNGRAAPTLFVMGLAAILIITMTLPVERSMTMGAVNAWLGLAFLVFGHRFSTHVLTGWALVLSAVILSLPLVTPDPVVTTLALVGGGCVLGSFHEHIAYMRRQGSRSPFVP